MFSIEGILVKREVGFKGFRCNLFSAYYECTKLIFLTAKLKMIILGNFLLGLFKFDSDGRNTAY